MNVPWILLTLLIVSHNSRSVKNDRTGPPFNGPNFIRNSRRIELNEYLVPPPPPRPHSLRSGRVANPTESPGYFSKLMNWLNPFNYGASRPTPPIETQFQQRGPPQFNLHPPLYPSLGPSQSGPAPNPLGINSGPPPPVYNPPTILHNAQTIRNNPGTYKGKSCNPCNKIPWIPMQTGGIQVSNVYLPSRDSQHSASHEIRVPNFSQGPVGQNILHHPVPPPLESVSPTSGQQTNVEIGGNLNEDLASSGTHTDEGQLSVAPQKYNVEVQNQPSGEENQNGDFKRHNFKGNGYFEESSAQNLGPTVNFNENGYFEESSTQNLGPSVNFKENGYRDESSAQNLGPTVNFNENGYFEESSTQNLGPSVNFKENGYREESSAQNLGSTLNFNYREESNAQNLGPISNFNTEDLSAIKNSQDSKDFVHFEESPLLDLTEKDQAHSDPKWPTSTVAYNVEEGLKTTTDYNLETEHVYFEDSSNFIRQESFSLGDVGALHTTPSVGYKNEDEFTTTNANYRQNGGEELLWTNLDLRNGTYGNGGGLDLFNRWNNSDDGRKFEKDGGQRLPSVKRNKQVQVVIPYTSEYTPIPFQQQSYGDWSVKTNFDKTQSRKVPSSNGNNVDNYVQQESRNDIQIINNLQSHLLNYNDSNKSSTQSVRTSLENNNTKSVVSKVNNSIDVRRLQKNIDNWTIQEYSKPTTSNTVISSSTHPYLLPSKKIPTKYLTTTESIDHNESVKTYSLAGFSFNEVEHEGSASNHIEETRTPVSVQRVETFKDSQITNKSTTEEKSTWKAYSVSISPVDKEKVYVVTPQTVLETSAKVKLQNENETNIDNNGNFSEFEAIEKAYQVLPQAVNNLAVASTGKENIPLWGIMEHEEFASLNTDETGEGTSGEGVDGPVLYSGHSKVSRAKR